LTAFAELLLDAAQPLRRARPVRPPQRSGGWTSSSGSQQQQWPRPKSKPSSLTGRHASPCGHTLGHLSAKAMT
jgi:hypothetical protein